MEQHRNTTSDSAALLELSAIINASHDLDFILGNVLLTAMGKLMITKACVFLRADDGRYVMRSCKGFTPGADMQSCAVNNPRTESRDLSKASADGTDETFYSVCKAAGLRYLIPMILKDAVVGILAFGGKYNADALNEDELLLLESIASVASAAVGNAMMIEELRATNRTLDERVQEQQTLYEISREMNAAFEEHAIHRLLGYALMGQMRILRYALFVETDSGFRPEIMKLERYREDEEALHALRHREEPYFAGTAADGSGVDRWLKEIGAVLVVPMQSQNKIIGLLFLGERMGTSGYGTPEVHFLQALANRTIVALENARMVREIIEKQRLEQQVQVARTIQRELLPRRLPDIKGYDISAENIPSQHVGGDYYDIVGLEGNRTLIAIADVSGKGIPASLLMANIQAGLRTLAPVDITLEEATARLNKLIYENTSADKFITFFWGILDVESHTLKYVNAGHNPPLLVKPDGTFGELDKGGVLLGVLDNPPPYELGTVTIEPGDSLVCYTDGFSEAMSAENEEFGEERVRALLTERQFASAKECMEAIHRELGAFTKGATQSDDITLIALHRS